MAGGEFHLETIHHILREFNKGGATDFSEVIQSLLKSESESIQQMNSQKSLTPQTQEGFANIKMLLILYEKLCTGSNSIVTELTVGALVQSLKCVLHCASESCNTPDTDIQCNILSIVSSLFKSVSPKNQEELAEFYIYILTCLNMKQGCKSDCLIFKLKVISSIYNAFRHIMFVPADEFIKKIKSINNVDECKLFTNLVLHDSDAVAKQVLMHLIPEYVNCFKSERVIEVTWKQISNSLVQPDRGNCRALIVLCNFFDTCLVKSKVVNKIDLTKLLLEDVKYWNLVQFALVEADPLKRKQGMFLLKKSIDLIKVADRDVVCDAGNKFYWHPDCKNDLLEIYHELIICLEFLEEQQVHIIKPVLSMVETLGRKIIDCDKLSSSWALLLYKKSLMHESPQIVKWGLSNFLRLPLNFFSLDYIVDETAELFVNALRNMSLYYNNGLAISSELTHFFRKLVGLDTAKCFFSLLIKKICSHVWSAEALFFVIHSLSGTQKLPCWGEAEIGELGMFVSKAFKTHNRIIRTGVQCDLLKAVTILTDTERVGLESLIIFISKFCMEELIEYKALDDLCNWLRNSYSRQAAENILERYKRREQWVNLNEKFVCAMLILFYFAFYSDVRDSPVLNFLRDMSSSFRDIHKRPYCNKLLYDQYLSVFYCTFKSLHLNQSNRLGSLSLLPLAESIAPFTKHIKHYIQTQLQRSSNLQDFNLCDSYFNSYEVILTIFAVSELKSNSALCVLKSSPLEIAECEPCGLFDYFYETDVKELEACLVSRSEISPIGIFWRIKLLSILMSRYCRDDGEVNSSFLYSYLLAYVNEPLDKDGDESKKTRDLQTLWGRLNSEFIQGKWIIFLRLSAEKLKETFNGTSEGERGSLLKLCLDGLNSGSYGVLRPVMSFLKVWLPVFEVDSEFKRVIGSVWKLMMERRKTEEFKSYVADFVELLYHEDFIKKGESAQEILFDYADLLFSDSSLTVTNVLMKRIQKTGLCILRYSVPLFSHIIGRGLIFGPVQRKDERLTNQVCSHIDTLNICLAGRFGDYGTANEIRARAVQLILQLNPKDQTHKTAAESLMETLKKMESEINKNKTRYFGNSHIHRVKHRLMQSLLLLEPMLSPNESRAKELCSWLFHCLMTENSQPSVRFQQEWLLVRMLLRHTDLYSRYLIYNNTEYNDKRSLCSVIAVSYHLCKLSPSILLEGKITVSEMLTMTMNEIFSLCFHQHFEVRLYAQVVFHKLYNFAKENELDEIKEKFSFVNVSLTKAFRTHLKGNHGKNLEKMLQDFYFTKFNPLCHYSLEAIYVDLPRLMNVDSDEWISAKTFQKCGVNSEEIRIPLNNTDLFTEYFSTENKGLVEKFRSAEMSDGAENPAVTVGNYQKKMIPQKPLIPGWDENCAGQNDVVKKDGLIVVASLIDRLPNLGGLARTCEVFGASEYVVGSLKYTEDKQFTSLSVTAEKWIRIKEVKPQNLLDYVSEMKLKGYTVIGAEQMLHSISLSSAKFPRKSLLLLGNEKEGIPPNLLPLLDICIEIPQLGIIRSLNVHVTGALFIWEYAKQNYFS